MAVLKHPLCHFTGFQRFKLMTMTFNGNVLRQIFVQNRIKMEIARRRHQIEENARLHEELIRLAKLRENAEGGGHPAHAHSHHPAAAHGDPHHRAAHHLAYPGADGLSPGPRTEVNIAKLTVDSSKNKTLSPQGNSVLRSVDEILRAEHSAPGGGLRHHGRGRHGPHDPHDPLVMSSSFNPDRYTAPVYSGVTDFSPVNSDFSNELLLGGVGGRHGPHPRAGTLYR